jgi:hypothetical protein
VDVRVRFSIKLASFSKAPQRNDQLYVGIWRTIKKDLKSQYKETVDDRIVECSFISIRTVGEELLSTREH